jgi:hypothetical protein
LLDACNFSRVDEFDLVLLNGVRNGFFDAASVKRRASILNDQIAAAKLDNSFREAWELYHASFESNQEQVLDAMYQSLFKATRQVTPTNMSSSVALFKTLGRSEQAAEIIKHYVASRGDDDKELFNVQNLVLFGEVIDPDVVKAFQDKYATFKSTRSPTDILISMADTNSWNPENITTLAALPVDDYYDMFKRSRGRDMRKIISACLQFDRIGNASPEMREISKRAKDALKLIGQESAINARRVKAYGVEVDRPEPEE